MLKLYDIIESQNGYKIRLALSNLKLEYELISVDLRNGEQRKDWFLELNPHGKVPTLVDDDFPVWESNAILLYLGRKFAPCNLIPQDVKKLGIMLEWMFFESTTLQRHIQTARFMTKFMPLFVSPEKINQNEIMAARKEAHKALEVLDKHLGKNDFITGEYSMADVACYGQIFPAEEGGIELTKYSNIKAWQKRVEKQPGYVAMKTVANV